MKPVILESVLMQVGTIFSRKPELASFDKLFGKVCKDFGRYFAKAALRPNYPSDDNKFPF